MAVKKLSAKVVCAKAQMAKADLPRYHAHSLPLGSGEVTLAFVLALLRCLGGRRVALPLGTSTSIGILNLVWILER